MKLVVGGSRGLGRGAVEALGATGIGRAQGDASDEKFAEQMLREYRPDVLVLCAGAKPHLGPIHELTWDQFRINWEMDAKMAFVWLRQALRLPLQPGSHVIVVSSGAAVQGSPVSGGYASAKRAQWFMADYANTEIARAGLGIRVHVVLPNINASTDLGRAGIAEYARRGGITEEQFLSRFGAPLTPEIFGAAIAELAAHPDKYPQLAYRLTGAGITPLS